MNLGDLEHERLIDDVAIVHRHATGFDDGIPTATFGDQDDLLGLGRRE